MSLEKINFLIRKRRAIAAYYAYIYLYKCKKISAAILGFYWSIVSMCLCIRSETRLLLVLMIIGINSVFVFNFPGISVLYRGIMVTRERSHIGGGLLGCSILFGLQALSKLYRFDNLPFGIVFVSNDVRHFFYFSFQSVYLGCGIVD